MPRHPFSDFALMVEDDRWQAVPDLEARCMAALDAAVAGAEEDDAPLELALVLTSDDAVRQLNRDYRQKDAPTNVLSFAARDADMPLPDDEDSEELPEPLGDVLVAWETTAAEAQEAGKTVGDHLSHLIVHGLLHLLGYDHEEEGEAEEMEALETEILAGLGIADPYAGV